MAHASQVFYFNEPVEKQLAFAAAVKTGRTIYLSGIVSINEKLEIIGPGDMAAQVSRVYDILEKTLELAGGTLQHVVNEVIYVTDIAALAQAAPVRAQRYAAYAPPCSTAVQIQALFLPGAMIELQATAVLDVGPD